MEAWKYLFSFPRAILVKPARGGATRNLANIILKRLGDRNDKSTPQFIPQRPTRSKHRNSDSHLAGSSNHQQAGGGQFARRNPRAVFGRQASTERRDAGSSSSQTPSAARDRKPACDFVGSARFQSLCLGTFPAGSSGGSDGFTAQNLGDILAGASDEKLKTTVTDFINAPLNGELPLPVREILSAAGSSLFTKKTGSKANCIGYTLRRLTAKCANSHVIKRSEELQLIQVGAGVSCGAEAAVHAVRRLVNHMPDNHVFVNWNLSIPSIPSE